jgi:hypothetical protein
VFDRRCAVATQMTSDGRGRSNSSLDEFENSLSGEAIVADRHPIRTPDGMADDRLLATQLCSQAHVTDRLIGAVAFSDVRDTAHETLIEAVEHGWWYSAPVPGARMVFMYMTDSDLWRDSAVAF